MVSHLEDVIEKDSRDLDQSPIESFEALAKLEPVIELPVAIVLGEGDAAIPIKWASLRFLSIARLKK